MDEPVAFGWDYGARASDDIVLERDGIVHPAVWPALANHVYVGELVDGPWIHTRSLIRHHGVGSAGATVDVHAVVVKEFEQTGLRVVCDVVIEHEAIVRPIGR